MTALSFGLLAALCITAIAGPPTLTIETRSSTRSGRYSFEPRNRPARHGAVDIRIDFTPLPDKVTPTAVFGDASFKVTSVSLTIDGRAHRFPSELLGSLGFCAPEAILFELDGGDGLLMAIDFAAGKERTTIPFRIRDGSVHKEAIK
jgi:hypothetical protein